MLGKRPSAVATLAERSTRSVRFVPLPHGHKADAVRRAIADDLAQRPPSMRRSLTWDRGREMAGHQQLAAQLELDAYFCDPRSPWQRGSSESTNRLPRQYLSDGADLRAVSMRALDDIARRVNTRPRRALGWATAHGRFWPHVRAASVS